MKSYNRPREKYSEPKETPARSTKDVAIQFGNQVAIQPFKVNSSLQKGFSLHAADVI